jgi:hypothetical protein
MEDHEGSRGMRAGSWEGGRKESPLPRSQRRRWEAAGGGAESLGERPKRAGKETGRGEVER